MNSESKLPTVTLPIEIRLGRIPTGSFSDVGINVHIGITPNPHYTLQTVKNLLVTEATYTTAPDDSRLIIANISIERCERLLKALIYYFTQLGVECAFNISGKLDRRDWVYLLYRYEVEPHRSRVKYNGKNITPENFAKKLVEISLKYKQKNDHTNI